MNKKLNYYNIIKSLIIKYKSIISYLVFGVTTTIINILIYALFAKIFNVYFVVSNIIAWIVAVSFAFITNKLYVFESKSKDRRVVIKESISFIIARLLSLLFDMIFMYVGIVLLKQNDIVIKIISNVLVIIINYVLSRYMVFKKVN
jgi:putative flippase GtrA